MSASEQRKPIKKGRVVKGKRLKGPTRFMRATRRQIVRRIQKMVNSLTPDARKNVVCVFVLIVIALALGINELLN